MRRLVVLLLCLIVSGCAASLSAGVLPREVTVVSPSPSPGTASPTVALGIFSGRPDPTWTLDAAQTADLLVMVDALAERTPWPGVDRLAPPYYGFRVEELDGGATTLFAYRDVVRLTSGEDETWLTDPACAVEAFLLASGENTVEPDLLSLVRAEMARVGERVAEGLQGPAAATATSPVTPAPGEALALYLTAADTRSADVMTATDLAAIPLAGDPLLTAADFTSYDPETYAFTLTPEADARIAALDVPVAGRAFILYVGGEPIYAGAFWTPVSSLSYDGVTIMVLRGMGAVSGDGRYTITLGYPGPDFYRGADPRDDPRVAAALAPADTR